MGFIQGNINKLLGIGAAVSKASQLSKDSEVKTQIEQEKLKNIKLKNKQLRMKNRAMKNMQDKGQSKVNQKSEFKDFYIGKEKVTDPKLIDYIKTHGTVKGDK